MTIETLATKHRLKTKKEGGEVIIPGKLGHLFTYSDEEIGAMFMPSKPSKGWKVRRDAFVKAGATVRQNGDTEGTVTFEWSRTDILKVVCKALQIRGKRKVTAANLEALKKAREKLSKGPRGSTRSTKSIKVE